MKSIGDSLQLQDRQQFPVRPVATETDSVARLAWSPAPRYVDKAGWITGNDRLVQRSHRHDLRVGGSESCDRPLIRMPGSHQVLNVDGVEYPLHRAERAAARHSYRRRWWSHGGVHSSTRIGVS